MAAARPAPFELVFGTHAPEWFGPLAAALAATRIDPLDRDAFLLLRETATLLRRLRPAEGLGAGVEHMAAFLHHAYLFWQQGEQLTALSEPQLAQLLSRLPARPDRPIARPTARYIQLPPLRVWATLADAAPAEPLDGWFVVPAGDALTLLAVFGLNAARAGFSVVEESGPPPALSARADGSPLFAPLLEGGAAAGLASLADGAELLELAWREAAA